MGENPQVLHSTDAFLFHFHSQSVTVRVNGAGAQLLQSRQKYERYSASKRD